MKRHLLLLTIVTFSVSTGIAQKWDTLFVLRKRMAPYFQNLAQQIDILNPAQGVSFYGNFDSSSTSNYLPLNKKYTITETGQSAGEITFDSSGSTLNGHCLNNGKEFFSGYIASKNAFEPNLFVRDASNKIVSIPEVQFDGPTNMIAPVNDNTYVIAGSFYQAIDKTGVVQTLYSFCFYDDVAKTLKIVNGGGLGGGYINHSIGRDKTIAINSRNHLHVFYYGSTDQKDGLYPALPNPYDDRRTTWVYVLDSTHMFAACQSIYPPFNNEILSLDFVGKKWVSIVKTQADVSREIEHDWQNQITNISGEEGSTIAFTGSFDSVNNQSIGHILQYNIITHDIKSYVEPRGVHDWSSCRVFQVAGNTYFSDGSKLLFGEEWWSKYRVVPLPLTLVSFKGQTVKGINTLTWVTEQEENTQYFDVERSQDGSTFFSIGKISAEGHSTIPSKYKIDDKNPFAGFNFYRLKMVDKDGKFNYSVVITLENKRDILDNPATAPFSVYPNPALHTVTVRFSDQSKGALMLVDVCGRILAVKAVPIGTPKIDIDVNQIQSGMYILQFKTDIGITYTKKFIKQ